MAPPIIKDPPILIKTKSGHCHFGYRLYLQDDFFYLYKENLNYCPAYLNRYAVAGVWIKNIYLPFFEGKVFHVGL